MSTKLYRSSGNETRETSLSASRGLSPPPPCPPTSPLSYLSSSFQHHPRESLCISLSVPAVPTLNFECITGPPLNLPLPPSPLLPPRPPLYPFQSPVRWRYNDHRHMSHGPAETCIFMSPACILRPPVTLGLSFLNSSAARKQW